MHIGYPWKGEHCYYTVEVDGKVNEDAAWQFLEPSAMVAHLNKHVARWHDVK